MLTEFVVEGGTGVDSSTWMAKLSELGITAEMDPSFDIHAHEGFVHIRWERLNAAVLDVGFHLSLGMPAPDVSAETFAKVVGRYERMLANLRNSKLPPAFVEAVEKKLVDLQAPDRTQYVRIRVDSKESHPGDYAAAALCSAAYAALSGGTLTDRQNGNLFTADEALEAMATSTYVSMPGDEVEFTGWPTAEAVAPTPAATKPAATKSAAKKPAAKKPVAKKPAAKKPLAKKPLAKKPLAKKPAKKPAAKKPVAKKPVAKKPAPKKTKKPAPKKR